MFVYHAATDGSINVMPDDEKIPFGTITNFDEYGKIDNITATDFDDLTRKSPNTAQTTCT